MNNNVCELEEAVKQIETARKLDEDIHILIKRVIKLITDTGISSNWTMGDRERVVYLIRLWKVSRKLMNSENK